MANTFSFLNIHCVFSTKNLAFLKKHGAHFDEKYLWDLAAPRSYRTLRDGSFEGRFPKALRARLRSVFVPTGHSEVSKKKSFA